LAGVVVGFIIVHLGTLISIEEFKRQWKTFVIGVSTVIGIGIALLVAALLFGERAPGGYEGVASALDFVIAGTGSLSGGTISVLIIQEAALGIGLTAVAVFPVLIAALQGLVGFPLTSIILRKEAQRLKGEYRAGRLTVPVVAEVGKAPATKLPAPFLTTAGTLLVVGLAVLVATLINNLTDGILNTFVVALIIGIALRATGVFKPAVLSGIDSFGLMMIAIMILIFGPLATVQPADVAALAFPLFIAFLFGVAGIAIFAGLVGKLLGYSVPISVAIGLTSLYGFPGTMILSQEAAKGAGESPDEVAAIEGDILPKMIIAGFSTVTITSVVVTSVIAAGIGS
ncbi:MAG: hypothetical protein EOL89_08745, partial [Actinobacteria bacterium]|nr:hypothetical protein [Actinomycetota bacterium]